MHNDQTALDKLRIASRAANVLRPASAEERNAILREAVNPDNVGCHHVASLLRGDVGRKELAQFAVQSFLNVLFDENPLRANLLFVVLKGDPAPSAPHVFVSAPDDCGSMAPLIVPNNGDSKVHVHHNRHVAFFRQDLARLLAFRHANLDANALFEEMNRLAQRHTGVGSGQELNSEPNSSNPLATAGPSFHVRFTSVFRT